MAVLESGESGSRKVTGSGRIRQDGVELVRFGIQSLDHDRCRNANGIGKWRKLFRNH